MSRLRTAGWVLLLAAAPALAPAQTADRPAGRASGAGTAARVGGAPSASPFGALTPVVQQGHRGPLRALSFSPDGLLLATSGADHLVRIWEASSGQLLRALAGHRAPVNGLGFGGHDLLVSAGEDGTLRLWSLARGAQKALIDVGEPLHAVAVSPDGQWIAVGTGRRGRGAEGAVQLFEASSGKPLARLTGHRAPVHELGFTPDSRTLISASADRTVRVWSVRPWEARGARLVRSLEGSHAVVLPAAGVVATAGAYPYRSVTLSEWSTGRRVRRIEVGARISGLAASPSGMYLAVADRQGALRVFSSRSGQLIREMPGAGPMGFSPDGRLLGLARAGGAIALVEPVTGHSVVEIAGRAGRVNALAFSLDGRRLAAADSDGTTRIWSVEGGRLLRKLLGHEAAVRSVAYAPTRSFVATAGDDDFLLVFDTALGKLHDEVQIPGVRRLLYSVDGTQLAAAAAGQTVIVPSGRRLRGQGLCIAPDSRRIALRLPGWPLQVRDLRSGDRLAQIDVLDAVAAAFSPDGATLAAAVPDGRVRLVDAASGDPRSDLPAEGGGALALAFDPQGGRLAVARQDGGVRIHALPGGEVVRRLWHDGAVRDVRYSPDGRRLATAGDDGVVRLWRAGSGELELQLWGLPEHDFVGIFSDGRILLPSDAAGWLRFTEGFRTYPLDSALRRLPSPELVAPLD